MARRLWYVIASIAVATMVVAGSIEWELGVDEGSHRTGGGYYEPGAVPDGTMPPAPDVIPPDEPSDHPGTPDWAYSLPLAPGDVQYLPYVGTQLHLTDGQMDALLEDGLVGVSQTPKDFGRFSDAYYEIDLGSFPMFITSDSVADAFHHHYANVLKEVEGGALKGQLRAFSERMVTLSQRQRSTLPDGQSALAEQNMVFFGVALRLLDPNATFVGYVADEIDTTVAAIEAANGTMVPPGFTTVEDLTQYEPRGYYAGSEALSRYFRAMMWYGRLTFRGVSDAETRRAVMASVALLDDFTANTTYSRIRASIDFLVGSPDDLTPEEYSLEARAVMGNLSRDITPLFDDGKLDTLEARLALLRPPGINSDLVPPGDDVWGLRVLGQASVLDSRIFERCTDLQVPRRWTPSGLDVMAALGSEEAWSREDFATYQPYLEENLGQLRDELAAKNGSYWSSDVYSSWLHALQALDDETWKASLPAFMGTDAWAAKQLNAQLASWTQLCHDSVLYRKQSYTYCGISPSLYTYVEPVPMFYWRLAIAVEYLDAMLTSMGLGTETTHKELGELDSVLKMYYAISVDELDCVEIDEDTMKWARFSYVKTVWGEFHLRHLDEVDSVVVADVHTVYDDSGPLWFLEEGVGLIRYIVVVAPSPDGPVACVGAVLEHHEFTRDASLGRLTDEEWQAMLAGGTAPPPAPWAQDFLL